MDNYRRRVGIAVTQGPKIMFFAPHVAPILAKFGLLLHAKFCQNRCMVRGGVSPQKLKILQNFGI